MNLVKPSTDSDYAPSRRGVRISGLMVLAFTLFLVSVSCGGDGGATSEATTTSPPQSVDPSNPGSRSISLERLWDGLENPVALLSPADDDRIFVVEQAGLVLVAPDPGGDLQTWLDLTDDVGTGEAEQGLLGLAFHPEFASNGRVYANFTDLNGDTQVVELTTEPAQDTSPARVGSRRTLLSIPQPYSNHNGGNLAFGPDGRLWTGTGDGGSANDPENRAQDDDSMLGKMIRIDVESGKSEVWAKGLRNPWRFSFDRETGDLWIGDVGQDQQEEIDVVRRDAVMGDAGPNFGWPAFEGSRRGNEDVDVDEPFAPAVVYDHDDPGGGGCSVTGGYVYRGPDLAGLSGRYVFGDYCSGIVWTVDAASPGAAERLDGVPDGLALSSFGEDADGRLYVLDHNGSAYMFTTV